MLSAGQLKYWCCYDYYRYDFYPDILEVPYRIFIVIFPVLAGQYICVALSPFSSRH